VARFAHEIHLVVPRQKRACSYEELEGLLGSRFAGKVHHSSVAALFGSEKPRVLDPSRTVVVTGSIYLAGEVMAELGQNAGLAEPHLQDF